MSGKERKKFGSTAFVFGEGGWHHLDADGRPIGGPYFRVFVQDTPRVAEVQGQYGKSWLIGLDGKKIADGMLAGNRKGHEDGPGKIVWAGELDKGADEAVALLPDGTIIGTFSRISVTPYKDVRWVEKNGSWRLLGVDGKLKGLKHISFASDFTQEGLSLVRIGKRLVFMNADGRRAWRKSYEEAYDFYRGRAWVRERDGWILIDTEGRKAGLHAYNDVMDADRDEPFSIAKSGKSWFLVRRQDGAHVPDEAFDAIERGYGTKGFVLRRGSQKEDFDPVSGSRKPHDARLARDRVLASMGDGEYDD